MNQALTKRFYFCAIQNSLISLNLKANYRVRYPCDCKDTESLDKMLITKLFQKQEKSDEKLNKYILSLKSLKSMGFKTYQVVEHPKLLKLLPDELNRRYALLSSACDKNLITLNMITNAKTKSLTSKLKDVIDKQIKIKSSKCFTEDLRILLNCDENEMAELFIKNPRLGGRRKQSNIISKIELLLKNGAQLEHIKNNTSLLNNVPFSVLEKRVERLCEIGYNKPLPVACLGRIESVFQEIVDKLLVNKESLSGKKINNNIEILNKISMFSGKNLYKHTDKVQYLLSKGYKDSDIIHCPNILTHSMKKIKTSVEYFENFHLNLVPLALCNNYSDQKSMVLLKRHRHRSKLSSIIDPHDDYNHTATLPDFYKTQSIDDVALIKSLEYLLSLGFEREHIIKLPVIICYNCVVLQQIWNDEIISHKDTSKNKMRLLNLMLYKLEKLKIFTNSVSLTCSEQNDVAIGSDNHNDDDLHYDALSDGQVGDSTDYEEHSFEDKHFHESFKLKTANTFR
ncbi:hypothetical protein HELRODRAFT_160499 [Helobdella robusta]|uniref:Uncharacterized protein n=1 Tax=Helobdella robusta TaxID=6412 RepID=T1EQB8_HELRO|nr:hypothetical protein HELRODRAFT_160499 [Helobdella robusta]ESO06335.1 hypothetical protein HELRODRAFT_160499 [Helobdella robusta]